MFDPVIYFSYTMKIVIIIIMLMLMIIVIHVNLFYVVIYGEWQGDCLIQVTQNRGIMKKNKNAILSHN